MKRAYKPLLIYLIFSIITHIPAYSTSYYSIKDGTWNDNSSWSHVSGGTACNCSPTSADSIIINHYITMTWDLINQGSNKNGITGVLTINAGATLDGGSTYSLDVRSTGTLYLCGTLIILNQTFSNGSYIYECPGGKLTINGDLVNKNNSNQVFINGSVTVKGTFENGIGGGGSSTIITIGTGGNINIIGGYINNGNILCDTTLINCPGNNPCNLNCGSTLPIELLSFNGKYENGNIYIGWKTASEVNNDYFLVQKSYDGINFSDLGKVSGAGNSSTLHSYTVTDQHPYYLSYYKLSQRDYDGTTYYFPTIVIKAADRKTNLQVYPNPSQGQFSILFNNEINGSGILLINDISGKEVYVSELNLQRGINSILDNSKCELSKGIYFVSVNINGEQYHEKLLVK